jgi:hypothetical protein
MRQSLGSMVLIAMALVVPAKAGADDLNVAPYLRNVPLGTLLDNARMDQSQAVVVSSSAAGHNTLALFVRLSRSSATEIRMTCAARYDSADQYNYALHACDANTSPWTCAPKTWSAVVSTSGTWVWHVPMMGDGVRCVFSSVGGAEKDRLTVKARLGVL